jgi:hypothetical protein
MRVRRAAVLFIVVLVGRLSAVEPPAPLFNGTTLAGFYTWLVDTKREDPRRVFSVTNRLLRISGDGLGYIATRGSYSNYHLVAEFKWGATNTHWGNRLGAARDAGIFLHGTGPDGNSHDGNGAFKAAVECQIMEGSLGDFLLIRGTNSDGALIAPRLRAEIAAMRDVDGWFFWERGGKRQTIERWGRLNWFGKSREWRDVFGFRGSRDLERPAGEWNRLECICDGDRIRIVVNGVVANEVEDVFPSHGQILLQCEGSEIFFRNLELTPLRKSK